MKPLEDTKRSLSLWTLDFRLYYFPCFFLDDLVLVENEKHTLEGEYERTKRQLAVKDAEIERLQKDLLNEQQMLTKLSDRVTKLQDLLKERQATPEVDNDHELFVSQLKVCTEKSLIGQQGCLRISNICEGEMFYLEYHQFLVHYSSP